MSESITSPLAAGAEAAGPAQNASITTAGAATTEPTAHTNGGGASTATTSNGSTPAPSTPSITPIAPPPPTAATESSANTSSTADGTSTTAVVPVAAPVVPRKRGRPPKNAAAHVVNASKQATATSSTTTSTPSTDVDTKPITSPPAAAIELDRNLLTLDANAASSSSSSMIVAPPPPPTDPLEGVTLSDDERNKLLVILQSLDPANILSQSIAAIDGQPSTLSQIVSDPFSSIPFLRTSVNTTCTTTLILSFSAPPSLHSSIETFRSTALSLLVELGRRRLSKRPAPSEETSLNGDAGKGITIPRPTKKYMLHRTLGGMDLYTTPTVMNDEEIQSISTLEDTDLISILSPTLVSQPPPNIAPSLGALNPRPTYYTRPPRTTPRPNPTQMLYYDPFQSFAPSYDSGGATLSYRQSVGYVGSKAVVAEWERGLIDATQEEEQRLNEVELGVVKEVLESEEWQRVVEEGSGGLNGDVGEEGVEQRLERNKRWLEKLIKAQLARTLLPSASSSINGPEMGLIAGEVENSMADKLVHSLSSLISSIAPSEPGRRRICPPPDQVRAATPRIMRRLARDPSYPGSMDPYNWRAIKESSLVTKSE